MRLFIIFFFKQKTAYEMRISDWSSDVCSSDLLFTPEMAGQLDRDRPRAATALAPESENIVLAKVREAAAAAGLWVHIGSLGLKDEGGKRWRNRSFIIDGAGAIQIGRASCRERVCQYV